MNSRCILFVCALLSLLAMGSQTYAATYIKKKIGTSYQGRPIYAYEFGKKGETVLFLGAQHGDEPQGAAMLKRFIAYLDQNPDRLCGKKVVIVPVVNPDGYARKTRVSGHRVDLNRNFPTQDWSPRYRRKHLYPGTRKPERETRIVMSLLKKHNPSAVISLHAYLRCNNYDGPGEALAWEMSRYNHFPVWPYVGYGTPGSLGKYAGVERNIPVITLELSRAPDDSEWARQRDAFLAAIAFDTNRTVSPYLDACIRGDIGALNAFYQSGTSLEEADETGRTALHIAVSRGDTNLVSFLLSKGANPNARSLHLWTPLMEAAQKGDTHLISMLISAGADVNLRDEYGSSALFETARYGHADSLSLFLAAGADPAVKDCEGNTVLLTAARRGYLKTTQLLVAAGLNVNERDPKGRTPIMEAAKNDFPTVVELLIGAGANIKARDVNGRTAMSEARKEKNRASIRVLQRAKSIPRVTETLRPAS